jgi:hypothetical protein
MMDADAMYPEGFHPIGMNRTPDGSRQAFHTTRTVAGVRYYFVDFGLSVHTSEANSQMLVTGNNGRDQDPPELSDTVLYNPFKLDIFIIGNMLKQEFCQVGVVRRHQLPFQLRVVQRFTNLDLLEPLIQEMTNPVPALRPDAAEAFALWKGIRGTVWTIKREWRPRPRLEHPIGTVVYDAISLRQVITTFAKSAAECIHM